MAQNSKIEWTSHTANLWWGCTKVHAGCVNCYAETLSNRWGFDVWGNDAPRRAVAGVWKLLDKIQKEAKERGVIERVFVGSMMDIFEKPFLIVDGKGDSVTKKSTSGNEKATTEDLRRLFFDLISREKFPNLYFLLLTKRPSNINKYIPEAWKRKPPSNVMFGTSISTNNQFDIVDKLLEVNGKRFLSIEPQLEEIIIPQYFKNNIDWIIQGGESGPGKRPFKIEWAYKMKELCRILNIPYFFKQIDKVQPVPIDLLIREFNKI